MTTATKQVRCGHCTTDYRYPVYHNSVAEVRECSQRYYASRAAQQQSLLPPPAPAKIESTVTLHDGLYTVVFGDGEHRTIRVRTSENPEFMLGRQILGYLAGPDNETSYKNFGHIDVRGNVHIWKRFAEADRLADAVKVLVADPRAAAGAYGLRSGRCGICGRPLTTPESLALGIGPVCAKRISF